MAKLLQSNQLSNLASNIDDSSINAVQIECRQKILTLANTHYFMHLLIHAIWL